MPGLQLVIWWFLVGASFVALVFALNEIRGVPLKTLFTLSGPRNIPRNFYLFVGCFFIAMALLTLLSGKHSAAVFFGLVTMLQFRQYGLAVRAANKGEDVTKD